MHAISLHHWASAKSPSRLLQVNKEHYLRDDIWSGTPLDPESDAASNKLAADAKQYLVVDTNVALSQVPPLPQSLSQGWPEPHYL